MMGWNGNDFGWMGMGVGMLLWLVVMIVVIWLVVRGLSAVDSRNKASGSSDSAEDVLRRRFAAGEIDTEEYQRRLAALRG
jgi:putative membrane protein